MCIPFHMLANALTVPVCQCFLIFVPSKTCCCFALGRAVRVVINDFQ